MRSKRYFTPLTFWIKHPSFLHLSLCSKPTRLAAHKFCHLHNTQSRPTVSRLPKLRAFYSLEELRVSFLEDQRNESNLYKFIDGIFDFSIILLFVSLHAARIILRISEGKLLETVTRLFHIAGRLVKIRATTEAEWPGDKIGERDE